MPLLIVAVVDEQASGRIGVGEMGIEGRIVGHCEILEQIGERVRVWMGRLGGGDSWL